MALHVKAVATATTATPAHGAVPSLSHTVTEVAVGVAAPTAEAASVEAGAASAVAPSAAVVAAEAGKPTYLQDFIIKDFKDSRVIKVLNVYSHANNCLRMSGERKVPIAALCRR